MRGTPLLDTRRLIGFGAVALVGYLVLPGLVDRFRGSTSVSAAEVMTSSPTPALGSFSPQGASEVADAYLEVPLANDKLMEEYSMQGRGLGNYANHSLLGDKYVAAMRANGMLDQYNSIYGGA